MTKPVYTYEQRYERAVEPVVWKSDLDQRYMLEVVRTSSYMANLYLFDHAKSDKLILQKEVTLNYDAQWGVDVENTNQWCEEVLQFVDTQYEDK